MLETSRSSFAKEPALVMLAVVIVMLFGPSPGYPLILSETSSTPAWVFVGSDRWPRCAPLSVDLEPIPCSARVGVDTCSDLRLETGVLFALEYEA